MDRHNQLAGMALNGASAAHRSHMGVAYSGGNRRISYLPDSLYDLNNLAKWPRVSLALGTTSLMAKRAYRTVRGAAPAKRVSQCGDGRLLRKLLLPLLLLLPCSILAVGFSI